MTLRRKADILDSIKERDITNMSQEIASQEPEKVETSSEHISIASLFKEEEKELEDMPIYEPLESQYSKCSTPDIKEKGKLPKTHTFLPDWKRINFFDKHAHEIE